MNIKKGLVLILLIVILTGCTNINSVTYDDIIDMVSIDAKNINTYRKGYKFYLPHGLQISTAGNNYIIFSTNNTNYYMYVDLISYISENKTTHNPNENAYYSKTFQYNNIDGYVEINFRQNNKYLIEIMYNYAKIEVMVDDDEINKTLLTAITLLKSIKYNATIIEKLVNDDNLDYTEEKFDMFVESINNSDVLQHIDDDNESNNTNEDIIDTDFLN